jgi:hypothetical protein
MVLVAIASAEPSIFFSKSFPGSVPPYVEIVLERDGKAVYKEAPDDDQPIKFQMSKAEADEIFALAEKVEHFKRKLESGLKVANMGEKTLRWQDGANRSETKFNFTQDLDGRAIQEWFEKMTESEQHYIALERSVKFDKLGANKAILQLQAAMERNRLVALEQYIPLLERVVKNESYLNMARERAANLIETIRKPKPKAE